MSKRPSRIPKAPSANFYCHSNYVILKCAMCIIMSLTRSWSKSCITFNFIVPFVNRELCHSDHSSQKNLSQLSTPTGFAQLQRSTLPKGITFPWQPITNAWNNSDEPYTLQSFPCGSLRLCQTSKTS